MSSSRILAKRLLPLAALVIAITPASAAINYTSGDIFIGFHQEGNTTGDFLVKVGAGALFRDATETRNFTLTGLSDQLSQIFGATWATDSTVLFGLIGTTQNVARNGDPVRTIYTSAPVGADAPVNASFNVQAEPANLIVSMITNYSGLNNSAVADSGVGSPANANSWTLGVGTSFNDSLLGSIETPIVDDLSFYRVPTTTSGGTVKLLGDFSYTGDDTFRFTPVPEPSSLLLLGLAGTGLGLLRPRRARATRLV